MYWFCFFVVLFFVYSVIGYLLEIISVSRIEKKIVISRGYLIGPYLPIFGCGAIIMISCLNQYREDYVVLFVMSLVICCLLEYLTSFVMEKIFNIRWWDYSNKKFNINGRVCLENGLLFGIGGVVIVHFFNPMLVRIILSFPKTFICFLGCIIFVVMFFDFVLSSYIIWRLKVDFHTYTEKDATAKVRQEIFASLRKYHYFHQRLFKAFPNVREYTYISKVKDLVEEAKRMYKKKK